MTPATTGSTCTTSAAANPKTAAFNPLRLVDAGAGLGLVLFIAGWALAAWPALGLLREVDAADTVLKEHVASPREAALAWAARQAGGMEECRVIVYPPSAGAGRRVLVDGEDLGPAHSLADLLEFLRGAGLDPDTLDITDPWLFEWRGAGPKVW